MQANVTDPNIFLCIPASAADIAAINCNGTKTPLGNGLSTCLIQFLLVMIQWVSLEIHVYCLSFYLHFTNTFARYIAKGIKFYKYLITRFS